MEKSLRYTQKNVAELIDEATYTLRYWEAQIPKLRPRKTKGRANSYTEKNLEMFKKVKHLIRDKKMDMDSVKIIISNEIYKLNTIGTKVVEVKKETEQPLLQKIARDIEKNDMQKEQIILSIDETKELLDVLKNLASFLKSYKNSE